MTGQSSRYTHSAGHSSIRTYSFELYGERIDPNLSQSHEKVKEEDQYLCSNGNSFNRPCKNRRAFSFKLFSEKIDPNLNQSNEKLKIEDDHNHRFLNGNGNSLRRSSISMGILDACNYDPDFMDNGYLSDGLPNGSSHYIHDKKKGLPWTRDEHKSFLMGLEKLGKGDWRGISKNYVKTRTPTQVASHAQKYFIRIKAHEKGKRRSSMFDMPNHSLSYGNEHKSSNPECSNINIGGLHPFKSSWTQRTSQTLFMSQPFTITYGSPRTSVVASTSKEILHE